MSVTNTFAICLWFGGDAEEAVRHYTSIFKNSKILSTRYHIEAGIERHRQKPGSGTTLIQVSQPVGIPHWNYVLTRSSK